MRQSKSELDMLSFGQNCHYDALRPSVCCMLFLSVSCTFQLCRYSGTGASAMLVELIVKAWISWFDCQSLTIACACMQQLLKVSLRTVNSLQQLLYAAPRLSLASESVWYIQCSSVENCSPDASTAHFTSALLHVQHLAAVFFAILAVSSLSLLYLRCPNKQIVPSKKSTPTQTPKLL